MATRRQQRSNDRRGSKAVQSAQLPGADASAETALNVVAALQTPPVDGGPIAASGLDVAAPVAETLMESVSPDALLTGQAEPEAAFVVPETVHSDDAPFQASQPAADVVTAVAEDDATSHGSSDVSTQGDSEAAQDTLLPAEIESAIASAQDLDSPPAHTTAVTASTLTEITAANDTLTAYVRNEGIATFAHWRALSTAKSPADALRLQVAEMQRAADASLSCITSLARRAGRIAATLRRP